MAGIVYSLAGDELLGEAEKLNPFDVVVKASADKANQVVEDGLHHIPGLDKIIDLKNDALTKAGEVSEDVRAGVEKQLENPIKKATKGLKKVIGLEDYKSPQVDGALTREEADKLLKHSEEIANRETQLKAIAEHKKALAKSITPEIDAKLSKFQDDLISGKNSFNEEFKNRPLHEIQVDQQEEFYNQFFPDEDALSKKDRWNVHDRLTVIDRLKLGIDQSDLPGPRKTKLRTLLSKPSGSAIKIFEDGKLAYKGARNLPNDVIEQQSTQPISDLTKVIKNTFEPELQNRLLTNQGIKLQPKTFSSTIEHFPTLKRTGNETLLDFRKQLASEVNKSDIFSADGPDIQKRIDANEKRFGITKPVSIDKLSGTAQQVGAGRVVQLQDLPKAGEEPGPIEKRIEEAREKGKEKEFEGEGQKLPEGPKIKLSKKALKLTDETGRDFFPEIDSEEERFLQLTKTQQDIDQIIQGIKDTEEFLDKIEDAESMSEIELSSETEGEKAERLQNLKTWKEQVKAKKDIIAKDLDNMGATKLSRKIKSRQVGRLTESRLLLQDLDEEMGKIKDQIKSDPKFKMDKIPQEELEDLTAGRATQPSPPPDAPSPDAPAPDAPAPDVPAPDAPPSEPEAEAPSTTDKLKAGAIGAGLTGAAIGGVALANKIEEQLDQADIDPNLKALLKGGLDQLKGVIEKVGSKGREQLTGSLKELENDLLQLAGLESRKSEVISLVNNPSTELGKRAQNRKELDELESAIRNQKEEIRQNANKIKKDSQAARRSADRKEATDKAKKKAEEERDQKTKKALDKGIVSAMPPIVLNISNNSDNSKLKKTVSPTSVVQTDNSKKTKTVSVSGDNNTTSQGSKKEKKVSKSMAR